MGFKKPILQYAFRSTPNGTFLSDVLAQVHLLLQIGPSKAVPAIAVLDVGGGQLGA